MYDVHSVRAAVALALLGFSIPSLSQETGHATELEEVVITASPIGDPDRLATIGGSVDREQLLRAGGNTLADALSQIPGVTSSGFAAGAGRPVIRGMDANRVRVLEDGIGSFDVSDVGPDHGVPIDPFAAERVEVVRGAATLRYGSQAIGGVVNSISNRVPVHLPDGTLTGELIGSLGSAADSRDFAAQFNARPGDFALHADGYTRHSGNYDTPLGEMANSWLRSQGGALGGAWIGDDNRIGVGVVRHESRYGIPGGDSFIDMGQTKLSLRSQWALHAGPWRQLTVDGGWADYEHSEIEDAAAASTFRDKEWDVRAEAVAGPWGVLSETALGVQMQQRNFVAQGEGADYLAPTRTRNSAVFGFAEAKLAPQWRLQFGARIEDVDLDGIPASGIPTSLGFTPLSASVGLVFDMAQAWRLGLALTSAARAPAQTELFARGVHDAPATYETGDPALRMERANSAELTLRWRAGRVHADGSLWVSDFSHFIYGDQTGRSCSEGGDCLPGGGAEFAELVYLQRGALFRGAEGHAQVDLLQRPGGDLHLDLMADTVRARLDDGAGNVPRIPPYRLGAGFSWQSPRLDAGVTLRYSGRQDHVGAGDPQTPGFTNVDAQIAWRPWLQRPGIEFALVGRNLTDSVQRNAVALNRENVIQQGRDIRLTLRARLE
ncbi:MAG: TonB-dependent receptor [Steroidobacteraceae bacterium]